jgi:TRAP-type mannitol/chloroaromatic compound transport system permease small subunit
MKKKISDLIGRILGWLIITAITLGLVALVLKLIRYIFNL